MEAKLYHIDAYLTQAGHKALDIIIIQEGECHVEMEVERYKNDLYNTTAPNSNGGSPRHKVTGMYGQHIRHGPSAKVEIVDLGRVGPGAVLCTDIALLHTINEDCYHRETVQATTIVSGFVIAKNDYYHHLHMDARQKVTELVKQYQPPHLATLWDCGAQQMGEEEYRLKAAWKLFRWELVHGKKGANIVNCHE